MNQWEDDTWTKEPLKIIWGAWESHDNKTNSLCLKQKNSYKNIWSRHQLYFFTIHSATSMIFPKSYLFITFLFICKTHTCQVHTDQWLDSSEISSYMSTKYFRWPSQTRSIQTKENQTMTHKWNQSQKVFSRERMFVKVI